MEAGRNEEGKINLVIGRTILGAVHGFRIGILAGGLVMLAAWSWGINGAILGASVLGATCLMGLVSGLATGVSQGRRTVLYAVIGALAASPGVVLMTTNLIPMLFLHYRTRLGLMLLKSVSPIHFLFAALVGLIIGIIISRMEEDVYFIVRWRL